MLELAYGSYLTSNLDETWCTTFYNFIKKLSSAIGDDLGIFPLKRGFAGGYLPTAARNIKHIIKL